MCNISKQKKLNIENIKDLTQSLLFLELFHIFVSFVFCFVLFYSTKLPGVAVRDLTQTMLTGIVLSDVTYETWGLGLRHVT